MKKIIVMQMKNQQILKCSEGILWRSNGQDRVISLLWLQSLVRELRSHKPRSKVKKKKKRGVGVGGRFREEHLTVTYNNNQTLSITCVPTVENPMNGEQKMYSNIRAYKIKGGRGVRSEKFSYRMFNSKTYCS